MKSKQLQKDWKEVELGDLGDISAGGTPSRGKLEYWGGNIPWLKISNLKDFYVKNYDETITKEGLKNSSAKLFKRGTILISIFASLGDVAILDIDSTTNQAIAGIYNLKKDVDREYLAYYLRTLKKYWEKIGRGVAQNNINLSILKKVKIPLPPLETQKAIVKILEQAEQLKQKREQSNKLIEEYLKSIFHEMFLNKELNNVEIDKGILKTENKNLGENFPEDYFDYIDISSIESESKKIIETKQLLGKDAPSRAKQLIKFRDVLVSTVRPNLNAVSLVPKELDNQICSTGYCILRADDKIFIPEYLFFISQTPYFIRSLVNKTKGANYPAVSNKDIKSLKIPFPSIELQQKFASIVEKVEKMKGKQKQSSKEINNLFNVLMQKAFKGELV